MSYVDKAENYFNSNFNCSQSVFAAFATEMGLKYGHCKELNLFRITCPEMIRCATEIVEQMLNA